MKICRQNLFFYKRYNNNIFILWKEVQIQLQQFLECLNINDRNIKLFWEITEPSRITEVAQMDKMALVKENKKPEQQFDQVPIILDYNVQ